MIKTGLTILDASERKSNKRRYVLYPPAIRLENGNVVLVDRIEYHRKTKKLTLFYMDDTEKLKYTIDLLSKYYEYMKLHQQSGHQVAMTQAASYLLKLSDLYQGFDIVELERHKQFIIDNYSTENDLEKLVESTKLDVTLIKAVLVLAGKIKFRVG